MSEMRILQSASNYHPVAAVLLALLLAAPAFSRNETNWKNLGNLKPGQRIGVIQSDGNRIEGAFAAVSDSTLSIRTDQVIAVPKDSVVWVYRRSRVSRGLRAAIGAGIGVALGVALNGTIGQYLRNEAHDTSPAVWIGAGAAAGAGIAAATGGGNRTVYSRAGHP